MELGVFNYQNRICASKPSFKRKLREEEKPRMEADMNKAFEYLGIRNRALIIHGSVYPDAQDGAINVHNSAPMIKNHHIGTPYRQRDFNKFVKTHGFNCIQLGPNGELCKGDNSPYRASIYAKNPIFLDFGEMTTDEYANILSEKDINKINIQSKSINKNYEMSDFDEAKEVARILNHKAFSNFKSKLEQGDIKAKKLNKEYEQFKKENDNWVEQYGVFHVLSNIHGTDNFHKWENPVDKHIFKLKKEGNKEAQERYETIRNRSKSDIEEYMFTQFLVDKQEKADKLERQKDGIKYIGDLLVGFSYADEIVHEDAFVPGWKVGAEYGGPCNSPQIWNNPLPDPKKLFNDDGTLGESGKLLYNKIKKATENVENVRVDNVMGLVDPYVYKANTVHMVNATDDQGKVHNVADRWTLKGGNLSSLGEVDPEGNYKKILHNIVLPTLKENGVDPQEVVWENLGEQTGTFKWVFEQQEKLPGIILPTGGRTEELCFEYLPVKDEKTGEVKRNDNGIEIWKKSPRRDWSLIGSHDNMPTAAYLNQGWIYQNSGGGYGWMSSYLGGYLNPDPNKVEEKDRFVSKIENNPRFRLKAKYAELMRGTQNVQVTFSDMFAIDKTYNPRDNSSDTWKVRMNKDYEDTYANDLITEDRPVMNMPELVGIAVNAKAGMIAASGEKPREEAYAEARPIMESMKYWEQVLKEKE